MQQSKWINRQLLLATLTVASLWSSPIQAQTADAVTMQRGTSITGGLAAIQAVTPKGELPGEKIPYFIRQGDGERHLVGGLVVNLIARGSDTGDLYEWAVITGGKGAQLPSHTHASTHEAILVLEGEVDLWLAGTHYRLIKGDFASVPPATAHAFRLMSHHTQLASITSGNRISALYQTMGKPYKGYVQPSDAVPALDETTLKKAEQTADVHFDGQPLSGQTPQRVTNAALPKTVAPYVLAAGEGDRYTIGDQLFGILSDNATTAGKLLVVTTEGPAGQMIGKHYHLKHSETFFCIDGQMSMWANQLLLDVNPGDYVAVPAGTIHAYQLKRPYTRFMGVLTPGIFENFFRSASAYSQHVYPQVPLGGPNFSKLNELDLVLLEGPPAPPSSQVKKD
ncbi:quercetin 2,3-dioxygenase [Spirosoma taeanense]|uniref:Quercetin 2,3-dioxygenase n=1 Tax=Spirosoma taeanense TaxID=2735870 RepID=A0A6M5YD90_9BACT|nr:quercetin 2,3-dioxygenase [Spirosoma taeanense]QJW91253.1 quercetin 2,3-dioxygenase [Spirosoma taeanense]